MELDAGVRFDAMREELQRVEGTMTRAQVQPAVAEQGDYLESGAMHN